MKLQGNSVEDVISPNVFKNTGVIGSRDLHLSPVLSLPELLFAQVTSVSVMWMGVMGGAGILFDTKGGKTYLPVALHWVCHLNKSHASSGEVGKSWVNEESRGLAELLRKCIRNMGIECL